MMMKIETVSIIGLGALGILFGNYLTKRMVSANVRVIADQERIRRYIEEQVYCNGECCQFHFMKPEERCEPADLILFTVKYQGLHDAVQAVRNQVGENTVILSALNGITSEKVIAETYGQDKVICCVAQGMDAVKIGNRLTYDHMGMLCFGSSEQGQSAKVKLLADFFEQVDFPYTVVNDMQRQLWGKFMLNVGVNQIVAVYESNYGEIQKEGEARDMMIAAMREVMALSQKEGINLKESDLSYWLGVLAKLSPEGKPSMRQDLEARRLSEVELFSGTVLEIGRKYGIATPVNQLLYRKIKDLESRY